MDASEAEKVSQLAKSLYTNRLAGSMDDAYKMAESILSRAAVGEARSMQDLTRDAPEAETPNQAAEPQKHKEHKAEHRPAEAKKEARHEAPKADPPKEDTVKDEPSESPKGRTDAEKLESLRRIITQEEERVAALRSELLQLKEGVDASGKAVGGVDSEIETLAKDIDSAKQDVDEIHQHIHDLEDVKREIREAEEAQEQADTMEEKAEELKERAGEWTPPGEGDEQ